MTAVGKALVVDDSSVNRLLLVRRLEALGLEVMQAENGVLALELLAANPGAVDVVLLDVLMPELDGLEATRRIRKRWPDRQLQIVAMTANAMAGDREACLAAGMDDYISKPIRPAELAAALERVPMAAARIVQRRPRKATKAKAKSNARA